ncbi:MULTISPECIES: serine/threonine-protein kinase [unclassified Microbacterium]|uniref:serine/threonine-protein kinase n=1 Tax=unclassified Microbacterium TaxID=2609290 RepID=UPI00341BFD91
MSLEVLSETEALLDGRYVMSDRLGRGGMATVYRAEDTHLERTVAIKMLHDGEGSTAFANRAHNEKALLAAVNHPSIVTLYDAQLLPDRPRYLVMEYVDGPTLARRLRTGPMRPRQVARLARDLAEGLTVVHGLGIVHRDVKPSNVLMGRDPGGGPRMAKLADFGVACQVGSPRMTSPGIVLGTFAYMAPETLRDAEPDTPVDVFSLGLVLLEALTGEPTYPASATGRGAAAARILNPPTIPDDLDDAWRDLLGAMTRLDPAERPAAHEVSRAAGRLMKADAATQPIAGTAHPTATVSVPSEESNAAPAENTSTRRTDHASGRKRRRAVTGIVAASALVATGALVLGLSNATPPSSVGPREAAADFDRATVAPAETVVEAVVTEQTPQAPVDQTEPGNNGNGNSGANGNSGNSGNSGNGNNGNNGDSGSDTRGSTP